MSPVVVMRDTISATLLGNNGVELAFHFEEVARFYQQTIPSLVNETLPVVEYLSFDYPWCVTDIQVLCGGTLLRNLPKTPLCVPVDFDVGGPNVRAGRLFLKRDPSCFVPRVRFIGAVTLPRPSIDGFYTYSIPNLTSNQTVQNYQESLCGVTLGNTTLDPRQKQFACNDALIACQVTPRPEPDHPVAPFVPLPLFACRGNVTPGGDTVIVWQINGYGLAYGTASVNYHVRFCNSYNNVSCIGPAAGTSLDNAILSGTRTQHISLLGSYASVLVFTYKGGETHHDAIYIRSLEPFIRNVPCVCGLSIDCDENGRAYDNGRGSTILLPGNIIPVADAGQNFSALLTVASVTLDATGSFDKDNGPYLLTYYWKVYNTTPSPIIIECATCAVTRITGPFVRGNYTFILYVSDGQDVTFDLLNVLFDENVIRVILPPDFDAQYDPLFLCPTLDTQGLPLLTSNETLSVVVLNGSATYNENPSFPLFYEWTQTTGDPIATTAPFVCDPATVEVLGFEAFWLRNESIAHFIPSKLGIYCFRLTVNDGTGERIQFEQICVSVEKDFKRPNATDRNYTDYPDSPTYNITGPLVPTITFAPTPPTPPINDLTRSPTTFVPTSQPIPTGSPTPIPPPSPSPIDTLIDYIRVLFPALPPPSVIAQLLLLFVTIACLLVFILLTGYCIAYLPVDDFDAYVEQQVLQQQ